MDEEQIFVKMKDDLPPSPSESTLPIQPPPQYKPLPVAQPLDRDVPMLDILSGKDKQDERIETEVTEDDFIDLADDKDGGGDDDIIVDDEEFVEEFVEEEEEEILSPRALKKEKETLLFKLWALQKKGINTSRKYTIDSNLEDMRDEYSILKHRVDMEASRAFSGKMLVMIITALEFLNEKFDPFELYLDGWSENVHENINDYDEVFDQLYEKYKEKVSVAPEVKLILMLGGSAFMFHMTNSMFKQPKNKEVDDEEDKAPPVYKPPVYKPPVYKPPDMNTFNREGIPKPRSSPKKINISIPSIPSPRTNAKPTSPESKTVADILNYIGNEPTAIMSNTEFDKEKNDDASSVGTMISVVTAGGTRRRKKKKRKIVLDI